MKRARGTVLDPASFEALSRVRHALREQSTVPNALHQAPHKPKPQPDGAVLFRRAVSDAVPLPPPNRAHIARPLPKPIARQRLRDEQQVLIDALSDPWDWEAAVSTGEELVFVRPGVIVPEALSIQLAWQSMAAALPVVMRTISLVEVSNSI